MLAFNCRYCSFLTFIVKGLNIYIYICMYIILKNDLYIVVSFPNEFNDI